MANNCGESIRIEGGLGASFIAFVLGATKINPLKPHYFCPNCRKIEFDKTARCGWDLTRKSCSCGNKLMRDGHDLPFTKQQFESLGLDKYVINIIDKIQYLFPKAHGITFVKGVLIMMWYKINHPDVFGKYF